MDQLRELYGLRDDKAIARELCRSEASVRNMADQIFDGEMNQGPWSESEIAKLKKYLGRSSLDVVSKLLRRPKEDIETVLKQLALEQSDAQWTQDEISELKRLYGTRTDEALALIFGRSEASVVEEAKSLRLAKDKAFLRRAKGEAAVTRMPRWRSDELELLAELYPAHSNLEIAQRLNRSVKSVVSKAHHLGIKKDASRLQQMGRENVSMRYGKQRGADGADGADGEE